MLGQYCSASQPMSLTCFKLQRITFKEALDDYIATIAGKRIRAIQYAYVGTTDELRSKILHHFKDAVVCPRTTSGYMIEFIYKGRNLDVIFYGDYSFRLCESYE